MNILANVHLRRAWKKHSVKVGRYSGVVALFAACGASGCALTNPNGAELYASLGMRAVHEHQESSRTIAAECGGLRAWVVGCPKEAPSTQEGS